TVGLTVPRPLPRGAFVAAALVAVTVVVTIGVGRLSRNFGVDLAAEVPRESTRSEEHTSELQSRGHLVCRLLLEKIKEIPWSVWLLFRQAVKMASILLCFRSFLKAV